MTVDEYYECDIGNPRGFPLLFTVNPGVFEGLFYALAIRHRLEEDHKNGEDDGLLTDYRVRIYSQAPPGYRAESEPSSSSYRDQMARRREATAHVPGFKVTLNHSWACGCAALTPLELADAGTQDVEIFSAPALPDTARRAAIVAGRILGSRLGAEVAALLYPPLVARALTRSPVRQVRALAHVLPHRATTPARAARSVREVMKNPRLEQGPRIGLLARNVVVIQAADDPAVDANTVISEIRASSRRHPNVELVGLRQGGHFPCLLGRGVLARTIARRQNWTR